MTMRSSAVYIVVALSCLLGLTYGVPLNVSMHSNKNNSIVRRAVIQAFGLGEPTIITEDWTSRMSGQEYEKMRAAFLNAEQRRSFGSQLDLNDREERANEIIMSNKLTEANLGFLEPYKFNPSQHFFEVLDKIGESKLFKLIKAMPKGGVLHGHDTALASTGLIIELTYKEHLWLCHNEIEDNLNPIEFKFSLTQPTHKPLLDCQWELVKEIRERKSNQWFDDEISRRLTLYPVMKFMDVNDAWVQFMKIFAVLDGIVLYAPAWKDYYRGTLKEFYADGVQYLEFRSLVPELYDLYNEKLPQMDTVQIYVETLAEFKKENPGFIGSKMIYAPLRNVESHVIDEYIQTAIEMKARYPDFIAGFDLVGQEDLGRPLKDFAVQLLAMPKNIDFYFHAAETNWNGASTDENLIDAVLLGTKRIGHGFGIVKHPNVLDAIKERDIAIEVNPLSNQVLQLVDDLRNHPCSYLFANNFPVVISSDDPSFWKASPLSHDFYVAFLGIASQHSDLRLLKQLAINSIAYSAMSAYEKEIAFIEWRNKWDQYIEMVITQYDN